MTTSYGERLLRQFLEVMIPDLDRKYNYRPPWLEGLELDIYFPQITFGVEFNGDQHYVVTDFGDPREQIRRDAKKRNLCQLRGVTLVTVNAIDLEYTRLNRIIKKPVHRRMRELHIGSAYIKTKFLSPIEKAHRQIENRGRTYKLKELNREATAYRKTLIEKYDSPFARREKKKPRKEALARRKSRQLPTF